MSATILVDSGIALEGDEITEEGAIIERYAGEAPDDETLIELAAQRGARVLVVLGDHYLVAASLWRRARDLGVALAVTHTPNPMEAANLVVEHGDELARLEPGTVSRLLAHGTEPARD